jgi:aquaporin Z
MQMSRRLGAEFFGTFWLTFAGCGSAVLAAGLPSLGIGFLGVSLACGLTVLTMAYAVGHVSGGHSIARSPLGSGPEAGSRPPAFSLISSHR